ncbi:MAG TPA: aminotransferase class I/II-fold pyridoxal phosphate-dependent enzyme [Verrucomicrobiota bacterium]|nr:aminotransferase class I/II-fold pyridoxal phosphate-dependent enzyme [Verrucomicrobiota bacterium]HNU49570.1 aminotransferase class I/II-fold pyridoxal phosphate-dependent enzyme [Verrucomicrobiota bacterium]
MTTVVPDREFIARHVRTLPRSGIREFFDIVQGMPDVISLGVGEPDFVTPWHIREAAIYALERGRTTYTSNLGLLRLREAIAESVARRFGVAYDPRRQILITVGVSEALDIALRAVLDPGDEVVYHEPCYVSYCPSIALAYGVPVAVPCRAEDHFAVTADAIAAVLTPRSKVLVLNFPTNPTGGTLTPAELEGIARLVRRHDLLVITDEIYSELTFEGEHRSLAALPGMAERTIFLHGFSKAYAMTGFRIGYACGPAHLVEAMMKIHQYSMLCASIVSQEAALEAIRNGDADTAEMREHYRLRRHVIVSAFNQMGLPCTLPRGSFYAFPCIRNTGLTSKEFAVRLLQEERVACVPGSAFGPAGEGYLRCCFATALDRIEIAVERIARFVRNVSR